MKFLNKVISGTNGWTGGQYSLFRVIFGLYLFVHFAMLAPWGAELFSSAGALSDGSASPLLHAFPNMFALADGPVFVTIVLVLAAVASLLLAGGLYDRAAAVFLWYVWACLFGRDPLISNPGLSYVGLMLVVHALLPAAPYGSWARRKLTDPGADWRLPQQLFVVVWILMALGYTYSGYTKLISPSWVNGTAIESVLGNPLARPSFLRDFMLSLPPALLNVATWGALATELLFAPLCLIPRLRPFVWAAMMSMHLGLITLINFADLSLGMVMLHLFTFNPAWVKALVPRFKVPASLTSLATGNTFAVIPPPPPVANTVPDRLFYDGNCGLCHGAVRFILAEDNQGGVVRFAPLDSDIFRAAVHEHVRATLPDSMVVLTPEGDILIRSQAWIRILARLGGVWGVLALGARLVPHAVLDFAYDRVASVRKQLFAKPSDVCPILPRQLRARFDY